MRPTRPTGLVPIDTCLECLHPPRVGASRHPPALRSLYSLPGWPGIAVENISTGGLGKGGGQGKKSTSVSEFLSSPPPTESAGYLRLGIPLADCFEGEHSRHFQDRVCGSTQGE